MDPARLRVGLPAVLLDLLFAGGAVLLSYRLRFGAADAAHFLSMSALTLALIVLLQLVLAAAAGLYLPRGQVMWPIRLAFGAITGALVGVLAATALDAAEGVSRQALTGQVAIFAIGGALWRSMAGLAVRRRRQRALRDEFGHLELVELGADLASMTGGVARALDYRHLLGNLVAQDLKLKYQRSVLGFAWSLLNPLLMIGVYTLAFRYVMRLQTPRFVLFILIGLLAWNFFAGTISGASDAVLGNGSLLRSVVFPRLVLPFSVVSFNLTQYLLTLAVFLPIMLGVYGVAPSPRMLLFPVFLLLQVVFTTGLTLLLATASTLYRDVKHLIEVGIGVLFWTTPILYEAKMIPEQFRQVALLSPMASYIRAYQDIFYYGVVPELAIWIVAVVYAAGMFVCGLSVFLAYEDRFSEYV